MLLSLENGKLEAWNVMYITLYQLDTEKFRSVVTGNRRMFVKYI